MIENILAQFQDVRKTNGLWMATCPCCQGKKVLRITSGDYRAFVHCYKKCSAESVLSAAGLTDRSLIYPKEQIVDYSNPPRFPNMSGDVRRCPAQSQPRTLSERHKKELEQGSGISPAIIQEMGAWTETGTGSEQLRKYGFSDGQLYSMPALVFPYQNILEETFYQIKPDKPILGEDGKPVKYMTPKRRNASEILYGIGVLPSIKSRVLDANKPLWVTEGAKKAGAAVTRGLNCVFVTGVWNWQKKSDDGNYTPLKEWEAIPLEGRTVYLAFDSDAMTKEEVHQALTELSKFLRTRGAMVRIIVFKDQDDLKKVGLDDFFVAGNSVEDLHDLAQDTLPAVIPSIEAAVVKEMKKRVRAKVTFSTVGIDFNGAGGLKTVEDIAKGLQGVEAQFRNVSSWIKGDLYLHLGKTVGRGQLLPEGCRIFRHMISSARDAATVCKAIPLEERRPGSRIPFFVWEIVASLPKDQRETILDTYEASNRRLSVVEVKNMVRVFKGLPEMSEKESADEYKEIDEEEQTKKLAKQMKGMTDQQIDKAIRITKELSGDDPPVYLASSMTRSAQALSGVLTATLEMDLTLNTKWFGDEELQEFTRGQNERRLAEEAAEKYRDSGRANWEQEDADEALPNFGNSEITNPPQMAKNSDFDLTNFGNSEITNAPEATKKGALNSEITELEAAPNFSLNIEKREEVSSFLSKEEEGQENSPWGDPETVKADRAQFTQFWKKSGRPMNRRSLSEFIGRDVAGLKFLSTTEMCVALSKFSSEEGERLRRESDSAIVSGTISLGFGDEGYAGGTDHSQTDNLGAFR